MNDTATLFRILASRRTVLPLSALIAFGAAHAAAAGDGLQDPTRPASARESRQLAPGELQLEAVMNSGAQRVAIVNGKLVRTGDRVGNARIDAIGADSIRYTREGRTAVATINTSRMQVRQPAARRAGDEP